MTTNIFYWCRIYANTLKSDMVFVGKNRYRHGRMFMSHMASDNLDELHDMAKKIGIDVRHFQDKPRKPHYDICANKKRFAMSCGAVEVSDRELILLCFSNDDNTKSTLL